jgi:four helix bundle protein
MGDYSELLFYQKARQVVTEVDKLVKSWPKTMQAQELSRQLFRSATSIGANIAEGHGRHEGTEYIHYLKIAQGSANETDHWLQTALDIRLGPEEAVKTLIEQNNEVRRMLTASINTLKAKRNERKVREESSFYNIEADSSDE